MNQHNRQNIALFGGSFDPPHREHTALIRELSARFDRVVVLPTRVSPFKIGAATASGDDRVEMLAACRFPDNVEISRYELDSQCVSYTVRTAQAFAEKYPFDTLYFVLGSDGIGKLSDWAEADRLATLVRFYVVGREGFPIDAERVEALKAQGFRIEVSDLDFADVSSSAVKVGLAFGKTDGLEKSVADYIAAHGLYTEWRKITDRYPEFGMKPERIEHTFRATLAGIKLAKLYGVKVDDAITALLLHDIGKYADEKLLARYGIEIPDEVRAMPAPIRHAPIGALIAQKAFKVRKKGILSAIRFHTTGKPRMTKLSAVVFLADMIESGRTFAGVEEIRAAAYADRKRGCEMALRRMISFIGDGELYRTTLDAYLYYRLANDSALKRKYKQGFITEAEILAEVLPQEKKPKKVAKKSAVAQSDLAKRIADLLSEKKGRNITVLDVRERTVIADYFVIAGAGSTTQVKALTDYVDEKLSKEDGIEPLHRDSTPKWNAVDYGSVILHVMTEDTREFYQLERLWN